MVSATGVLRTEGFPYALDNGAWSAHQQGQPFDAGLFERAMALLGAGADWIVAPDVVGKREESLRLSLQWLDRILAINRCALIPVQDGMVPADVAAFLGPRVGIFVGGDPRTNWKEESLPTWGELARARGCYLHVGRVNSARRIRLCAAAGADSFDGTSASKYAVTLPALDEARRQKRFFL